MLDFDHILTLVTANGRDAQHRFSCPSGVFQQRRHEEQDTETTAYARCGRWRSAEMFQKLLIPGRDAIVASSDAGMTTEAHSRTGKQ